MPIISGGRSKGRLSLAVALASLAGNVDPHHRVAVADLILVQSTVRSTVERLVRQLEPALRGPGIFVLLDRTPVPHDERDRISVALKELLT